MSHTQQHPWEILREHMHQEDAAGLNDYVSGLSSEDSLRAILRLSPQEQQQLLMTISPEAAVEIFEAAPDEQTADLLEELPAQEAASIVSEMASDDQADVLAELDVQDAEEILQYMDAAEADEARALIAYDPDVAGGLMMKEYFSYPKHMPVGDVIDDLAAREDEYELFNALYLYVTGPAGRLAGIVRTRDLVLSAPGQRLAEIARPAQSVPDTASLHQLEEFFTHGSLSVAPVVDDKNRLVGVVRRRAVFDAVAEKAELDHLKTQGIVGGEELRSLPTLTRSRRRLSWLSVNIVLNVIAASVIAMFQDVLSAVIILAVFLPIISDMSGCSGNQAVAVSMRELTLGFIKPADFFYVLRKEAIVGLANGAVLGLLIAGVAWAWQGNAWLGLVVGAALAMNTLIAVSIGGTVPVVLKTLRVDPAIASGPILTTITDMFGFFLLLGFASLMLPYLAPA